MGDRLATIDMGRKLRGCCARFCGGSWSSSNTMSPGPRPTSVPSGILIQPAVWPQYTNITDRTDRHDISPIAYGGPFYKWAGAQPRFQSWGVQFLGLGYCTEQNTEGIPSFVDCSLLRNGITLFIKKVGVVRPNFGGSVPPPSGPQWLRPCKWALKN